MQDRKEHTSGEYLRQNRLSIDFYTSMSLYRIDTGNTEMQQLRLNLHIIHCSVTSVETVHFFLTPLHALSSFLVRHFHVLQIHAMQF